MKVIVTDNASYMCASVTKLFHRVSIFSSISRRIEDFHVQFIGHVVNFVVKDCLNLVCNSVLNVGTVISSIRSSVKRHNLY